MSNGAISPVVQCDVEVQHLQSQIQDWKTCPTTDAKTKATIVSRLETKLESVKAAIESRQKSTDSAMTGLGQSLDKRS